MEVLHKNVPGSPTIENLPKKLCPSPIRDLLAHYKNKIDLLKKDHLKYVSKIDDSDGSRETRRKLQIIISERNAKIASLQQELNDAKLLLYDEREIAQSLKAQNDELLLENKKCYRKIERLLALTQPVSEEDTYFVSSEKIGKKPYIYAPPSIRKFKNANFCQDECENDGIFWKNLEREPNISTQIESDFTPKEIEDIDFVINSLKRQLEEQIQLSADRHAAYEEERLKRKEQEMEHEKRIKEENSVLKEQLNEVQNLYELTTKEYFDILNSLDEMKTKQHEDKILIQAKKAQLQSLLENCAKSNLEKEREIEESLNKESRHLVNGLRGRAISAEEKLMIIREQYAAAQEMFTQRIQALENSAETWKKKYKMLERKRNLEFEGYANDITSIQKRLREYEKNICEDKADDFWKEWKKLVVNNKAVKKKKGIILDVNKVKRKKGIILDVNKVKRKKGKLQKKKIEKKKNTITDTKKHLIAERKGEENNFNSLNSLKEELGKLKLGIEQKVY